MKYIIRLSIVLSVLIPSIAFSQKDTLVKKLDSLNVTESKTNNGKNNNTSAAAYNDSTKFTLKNYFVLLGNDFKQQVTYPFHTNRNDFKKIALFGAAVAGLTFVDEPGSEFFAKLAKRNKGVASTSNFVTSFGGLYEVYTLAALTTYGYVFKNEKVKSTALLATQAYITAGAIQGVLKYISGRQRPNYISPVTKIADPTFHGPFYKFPVQTSGISSNSAFPSGHTTVAFAAATVYAMEYRSHPLIPILSYSFATVVGLSRLTENKHWPTDVLAGAALGILSGRQVVNNYHRYMKIKQPEKPLRKKRGALSFNISPVYGKLQPGVVYSIY